MTFSSICLILFAATATVAAEKIRLFYDVGPKTYEIIGFDEGLPVLGREVETMLERKGGANGWSYTGELPLDPEYASTCAYRVSGVPETYTSWRSDHPTE